MSRCVAGLNLYEPCECPSCMPPDAEPEQVRCDGCGGEIDGGPVEVDGMTLCAKCAEEDV